MGTYSVLLTRETSWGEILDAWEAYRGGSLAAAVEVRHEAVQRMIRAFDWPGEPPRPALAVRLFAIGIGPGESAYEYDRCVLPEVRAPIDPKTFAAMADIVVTPDPPLTHPRTTPCATPTPC